jgi:hypothetical protein
MGLGALATNAAVTIQRNHIRNVGRQLDGSGPVLFTASSIILADNYAAAPVVAGNILYNSALIGIWDFAVFAPSPGPKIEGNTLVDCGWAGIWSDSSRSSLINASAEGEGRLVGRSRGSSRCGTPIG